jgi:hypothetical protein
VRRGGVRPPPLRHSAASSLHLFLPPDDSMQYYEMWFNLKDSRRDLEFAKNVGAYLGHLKSQAKIEGWRLSRRKFGFGPAGLGEFHVTVWTRDMAQLDSAFDLVSTRAGEIETLHAPVYSMVTDFTSALYRDFPDPGRHILGVETSQSPTG